MTGWRAKPGFRKFLGLAGLLASGAAAAIGMVLLASGQWRVGSADVRLQLVLYLPWYAFALSVAKFGIDQLVFVAISSDRAVRASIGRHLGTITLPVAVVVSLLSAGNYGWPVGVLTFLALVADVKGASAYAELTARERYWECSIAGLLNYPLFFGSLALVNMSADVGLVEAIAMFTGSSVVRSLWLQAWLRQFRELQGLPVVASWSIGLQQAMNFWIFRGDQVVLAQERGMALLGHPDEGFIGVYAFLSRYPEVLSSVMVAVGSVFLPDLYRRFVARDGESQVMGTLWAHLTIYAAAVLLPLVFYPLLFTGSTIELTVVVPFALSSLLILPANVLTYAMMRSREISELNYLLVVAAAIALPVLAIPAAGGSPWWLSVVVPLQLSVFVVLGIRYVRRT